MPGPRPNAPGSYVSACWKTAVRRRTDAFQPGVLAEYIGRKNATLVEMGLIMVALLFVYFFVNSYSSLLAMGVLLGIAGASFGVALSLGSDAFPARYRGLAMGLVGASNVDRCFGAGGTSTGTAFRHSRSRRVMLCFAALGAGNGALFQLVPLRWSPQWPAP